jgi:hypothetical protein
MAPLLGVAIIGSCFHSCPSSRQPATFLPTSRIVTSRKDLVATNESWLGLFVAHGITGIREMGTDIPEAVFQWREEINSGSRLSRVF